MSEVSSNSMAHASLISYRRRLGRFDQNTLVGMHHPNKDLVGMSGEMAAAVTKDCFGFNPEN